MSDFFEDLFRSISNFWSNNGFIGFVGKLIIGGWAAFIGIHNYFYYISILVLINALTGIWASFKSKRKFSKDLMFVGTIQKFSIYTVLLCSVWIMDSLFKDIYHHEPFYGTLFLTIFVGTYEIGSIFSNMFKINPNLLFIERILRVLNYFEDATEKRIMKGIDEELDKGIKEDDDIEDYYDDKNTNDDYK